MLTHLVIGAVIANWFLVLCKINELSGGESSPISQNRRLPLDSDAVVAGLLTGAGALVGAVVAFVCRQQGIADVAAYRLVTAGIAFVIGILGPLPLVIHLKKGYLRRAIENFEKGNYKHAMEDAAEVVRSAYDYATKQIATEVRDRAAALRPEQVGAKLR